MNLTKITHWKSIWLFAMMLFYLSPLSGQSFFQTYPDALTTTVREIAETNAGLEVRNETGESTAPFPSYPSFIHTDNNGLLESFEVFDELDLDDVPGTETLYLSNGNYFLAEPNNVNFSTEIFFSVRALNGNMLNNFSITLPVGTVGRATAMAEFSNGDVLVSYYYGEKTPPNEEIKTLVFVRINPLTGQMVWQNEFDTQNNIIVADIVDIVINENDEIFGLIKEIALNSSNTSFFAVQLTQNAVAWMQELSATFAAEAFELYLSSDNGIWYWYGNSITKISAQNGNQLGTVNLANEFTESIDLGSITVAADGGILAFGKTDTDIFSVRLNSEVEVTNTNIIEGVIPIPLFTPRSRGTQLASSDFVIGGRIDESGLGYYPFLIQLNNNGEFDTVTNDGVDLELSISTSNANPPIYGTASITLEVTNTGSSPASSVNIEFKRPANITYTGGNEFTTSQGNFLPYSNEVWQVGTLGGGESATLTVNYFMLTAEARTAYAQVVAQNENDDDSTPGNGTPPNPTEDDEAAITLNGNSTPNFPDLVLSNLATNFPATLESGVDYSFSAILDNVGNANAAGNFRIGAYLSADVNLDNNDFLVGEINTGNISAATNLNGLIQIFSGIPSGEYFFFLVADDLDQIAESNEGNNTVSTNQTFAVNNSTPDCVGNFVATTQTELAVFNQSCTTWAGSITVGGSVTDLSPLSNLEVILGNLIIEDSEVSDLSPLAGLQETGTLFLYFNENLLNLNGLPATIATGSIQIIGNSNLISLNGLPVVTNSLDNFTIANNASLQNIQSAATLSGNFPDLNLVISSNLNLTALTGLENITAVETIIVDDNGLLSDCCAIFDLLDSENYDNATISNNLNCNSVQDVLDACGGGSGDGSCGFVQTYPNQLLPGNNVSIQAEETTNGYRILQSIRDFANDETDLSELTTNFAGEEIGLDLSSVPFSSNPQTLVSDEGEDLTITYNDANGNEVFSTDVVINPNAGTILDQIAGNISTANNGFLYVGTTVVQTANSVIFFPYIIRFDTNGAFLGSDFLPDDDVLTGSNVITQSTGTGDYVVIARSGNFDLHLIDNQGQVVWKVDLFVDTPASRLFEVEEAPNGSAVYVSLRDNQVGVLQKYAAADGSLIYEVDYGAAFYPNGNIVAIFEEVEKFIPLPDGGAVFGGSVNTFGASPNRRYAYARVDNTGNTVWSGEFTGLSRSSLTAQTMTSDGGFLFVGPFSPSGEEVLTLLKLTNDGQLVPTCEDDNIGGVEGVDLTLDITSTATQTEIYNFFTVTVTTTNEGNEDASGIIVDVPLPQGLTFQGGNEFYTATGTYAAYGNQQWSVGDLAAGISTTLNINYFVLSDNDTRIYGQVIAQNETDADSSPNNGTPPTTNEDDEAILVLASASSGLISSHHNSLQVMPNQKAVDLIWVNNLGDEIVNFEIERSADGKNFMPILSNNSKGGHHLKIYQNKDHYPQVGQNFYRLKTYFEDETIQFTNPQLVEFKDLSNFSLFPNPASDYVNIYLKETEGKVQVKLINLQGLTVKSIEFYSQYAPIYQLDVTDIRDGQYLIWVFEESKRPQTKQIMIAK